MPVAWAARCPRLAPVCFAPFAGPGSMHLLPQPCRTAAASTGGERGGWAGREVRRLAPGQAAGPGPGGGSALPTGAVADSGGGWYGRPQ